MSLSRLRTATVPLIMVLVGALAVGVIATLQARADGARVSQNRVNELSHATQQHSLIPRAVGPGVSTLALRLGMAQFRDQVDELSAELNTAGAPVTIPRAIKTIDAVMVIDDRLFASAVKQGRPADTRSPGSAQQTALYTQLDQQLRAAKAVYSQRAQAARRRATIGTALTVMLLLGAFAVYYFRSVRDHKISRRLLVENEALLTASRHDALTDALTGLRNRRALSADLADLLAAGDKDEAQQVVALFDLDGFKRYNDTFGHAAGDELLTRLGRHLRIVADASKAKAYRLGGDEFCVVYDGEPDDLDTRLASARAALTDEGSGWKIGSSAGAVRVPAEAVDVETALVLADERMYRDKAHRKSRATTIRPMTAELRARLKDGATGPVAAMAAAVAEHVGVPAEDLEALRLAADLHDIGKSAIPDSILAKQGELDDDEWAFVRHHTLTGGRLVFAAHARANTAALVRSSHEHFDGSGYPDGLAGAAIPLGARIIAVCDAFNAMTSERPFREAKSTRQAIRELRACAGTQFDPVVVEAFEASGAATRAATSESGASASTKPVRATPSTSTSERPAA